MITIECCPTEYLPAAWNLIDTDLDKFDWSQEIEAKHALPAKLADNIYQLWMIFEDGNYTGFTITYSFVENGERKLAFQYLGGRNLGHWINLISVIEQTAKDAGFVEFMAWTRPGIAKQMIEHFGYKLELKTKQKWEVTKR